MELQCDPPGAEEIPMLGMRADWRSRMTGPAPQLEAAAVGITPHGIRMSFDAYISAGSRSELL